jgi:serine/threonine-protein kinase
MSQDPVPIREGDLLAGKYRVEAVLGVGGMGVVVAARHEQLDQRVAIKFVRPEALGNREAVERFVREARATAKLKSEHAAKVLDVGRLETGAPYMVMEFLEGSDLGRVLQERGPLPVGQAVEWTVQACEAVAEAHAAGIVHRDLKPENLFLARTVGGAMRIKVLDFGVSKSLSLGSGGGALTHTRAMLGSPMYMSPEQMRSSRTVDARSDVWALGVVLFELLSNQRPFEAETLPDLCLSVVAAPPRPLLGIRPELPHGLVDIVNRCLHKDPAARFANAAELALALEPFAPPSCEVNVLRARMAVQSSRSVPGIATPSGSGGTARMPSTPSGWGSGKPSDSRGATKRWPALVSAIAVLVALAGGVGIVMVTVRLARPSAPTARAGLASEHAPPPPASPLGEPAAAVPSARSVEPAVPALAPASQLASASAGLPASGPSDADVGPARAGHAGASTSTAASAASLVPLAAAGSDVAPPVPVAKAPAPRWVAPAPPVRSAAPKGADDDIPALR